MLDRIHGQLGIMSWSVWADCYKEHELNQMFEDIVTVFNKKLGKYETRKD